MAEGNSFNHAEEHNIQSSSGDETSGDFSMIETSRIQHPIADVTKEDLKKMKTKLTQENLILNQKLEEQKKGMKFLEQKFEEKFETLAVRIHELETENKNLEKKIVEKEENFEREKKAFQNVIDELKTIMELKDVRCERVQEKMNHLKTENRNLKEALAKKEADFERVRRKKNDLARELKKQKNKFNDEMERQLADMEELSAWQIIIRMFREPIYGPKKKKEDLENGEV